MAGAELQGELSASVTFSAWLKMSNDFVVRASLIFSASFSKVAVDPTTTLLALMGGTDAKGRLFNDNHTAVVEALYRQVMPKHPMLSDMLSSMLLSMLSSMPSDMLSSMLSSMLSDMLSSMLSSMLSEMLSTILFFMVRGQYCVRDMGTQRHTCGICSRMRAVCTS